MSKKRQRQVFTHGKDQAPSLPQNNRQRVAARLVIGLFLTAIAVIGGIVGYHFLPSTADPETRLDSIFGGAIIFLVLTILPGVIAYDIYKRRWQMWGMLFLICAALAIGGIIGYFAVPGAFDGLGALIGAGAFLFLGIIFVDVGRSIYQERIRRPLFWLVTALLSTLIVGGIPGFFFLPHIIHPFARFLLGAFIGSIVLEILKNPKDFFEGSGDGLIEFLIEGGCGCLFGHLILLTTLTIAISGLIIWLI